MADLDYRRIAITVGCRRAIYTDRWILRCAERCGAAIRITQRDSMLHPAVRILAERAYAAGWEVDGDGDPLCPACAKEDAERRREQEEGTAG